MIAVSARLPDTQQVGGFTTGILTQISSLIHTLPDGLVCVASGAERPQLQLEIQASAGRYAAQVGRLLDAHTYDRLADEVGEVLRLRKSLFKERISFLYIPVTKLGEAVVVINTPGPIKDLDRKLLELFSINIAGGGGHNSFMVQRIENLAFVDQLTGLPDLFTLIRHFADSLDTGSSYVLGMADVDNFESVNKGLGRDVGDCVLRQIGNEVRTTPEVLFVARAGGDVFAFLLIAPQNLSPAEQLHRISAKLKKTLMVEKAYVSVSVTTGATVFKPGVLNPSAVVGNAGIAMKNAKQRRLGGVLLFEESMNAELRTRLNVTARTHKAVEDKAFFLPYQPQISLTTGKIFGVEALIRWRDGNDVIPPEQFIAVAESSGLILPLGKWVLGTALAQKKLWRSEGMKPVRMSVNLSSRQLIEDEGLVDFVRGALAAHECEPSELELEVTETLVMSDMESGINRLRRLRDMGVQIAIDDFGTGYSSLGQLRHLPVNRLKIDPVFIQGLDTNPTTSPSPR